MIKIGIAVFAYNRSHHLERTLDALRKNEGVDNLYIFQDGLKCEADRKEWDKTREIINNITWCKTKIYDSKENKGLADSIVTGIDKVLEENEAVIVLEDDCVPQPAFVQFMRQCFKKYQQNEQVYSISGYSWPIELEKNESDIYFCGRPCSWGWGTWKDRWLQYKRDYNMLIDIKKNRESSRRLAMWGDDLETMLIFNIQGITNSWYVFWALLLIQKNGYAINPYESLIQNEGFDGTGIHCGKTSLFNHDTLSNKKSNHKFILPEIANIDLQTQKSFSNLYGNYIAESYNEKNDNVLIYGVGNLYKRNAKQINDKYNIVAFVDKYKKDKFYAGIDIIHPKQIAEKKYDYVIIMINDEKERNEAKEELLHVYGINSDKIKLGLVE